MSESNSKKTIQLQNREIAYTLKKSRRARRARLTIYCDGKIVATMPRGLSFEKIEEFILEKSDWVLKKIKIFQERSKKGFSLRLEKREYQRVKSKALALAENKLQKYNQFYGFGWKKISIRNQKTRWGSCSRNGNLSYNCKIALLPEKYADYVIVHELCHLKEFNHSKRFWDLVKKTIPDCREIRRELKKL